MYPPGYQLQSQRVQAAYRYGDISFCHCIIDHTFWKVLFPFCDIMKSEGSSVDQLSRC